MTIRQSTTTITIEVDKLIVSRIISSKLESFTVNLEGSVADLLDKSAKCVALNDELFKDFSHISKASTNEPQENENV